MARPGFKRLFTRVLSPAAERSTYVLASSLALILLFWQWQPLGGVVWEVEHPVGRALFYGGFAIGWPLVLSATFMINHFDLFGLRQTWRDSGDIRRNRAFVTPILYARADPLYLGWLLAFWSTPTMTLTHLSWRRDHDVHLLGHSVRRTRPDGRASDTPAIADESPMLGPAWRPRAMPKDAARHAGV